VGGAFAVGYNSTVLTGAGGSALRGAPMPAGGSLEPARAVRAAREALAKGNARRQRR
jgi:hypothetical protein